MKITNIKSIHFGNNNQTKQNTPIHLKLSNRKQTIDSIIDNFYSPVLTELKECARQIYITQESFGEFTSKSKKRRLNQKLKQLQTKLEDLLQKKQGYELMLDRASKGTMVIAHINKNEKIKKI